MRRVPARRVFITGLANHWGSRLAAELAQDPEVEQVVGVKIELMCLRQKRIDSGFYNASALTLGKG